MYALRLAIFAAAEGSKISRLARDRTKSKLSWKEHKKYLIDGQRYIK